MLILIGLVFLIVGSLLAHDAWSNRFRYVTEAGWKPTPARVLAWGFEEVGDGPGPLPVMEPQYWVEVALDGADAQPERFRERLQRGALVNTPMGRQKAVDLQEGDAVIAWLLPDASAPPTIAPTSGSSTSMRILVSAAVLLFGVLMFGAGLAAL